MALSNASFRDLLAKKEEEQQSKPQRADTQEERQRKKAKAQAAYERRMAIQKRREEALAEASRYTDRAAERRKEETKESRENGRQPEPFNDMEEEEDADAVVSSAPTFAQLGDREDLAQQQHRVSIAQSKYLGGDIEHTHLVKGLDFALLQKMRSELSGTKTKEMEGNAKKESMSTQVNEIASGKGKARKLSAPSSGSNAAKASTSIKPTKPTKLAFATELGRDVHRSIFGTNSRPNKALAEGRLVLIFDVSGTRGDAPSSLIRQPDDLSGPRRKHKNLMDGSLPDGLQNRLSKVMAYSVGRGAGDLRTKKSKKEKLVASAALVMKPLATRKVTPPTTKETKFQPVVFPKGVPPPPPAGTIGQRKLVPPTPPPGGKLGSGVSKPMAAMDDVDDIFGDGVGSDYVCQPNEEQRKKATKDRLDAKLLGGKSYFDEEVTTASSQKAAFCSESVFACACWHRSHSICPSQRAFAHNAIFADF
uniref:RED-like N-terminal domain-containing protein n=1 Tax=Haptolina ericina TaxID=156174 RepID=A0A7S3AXB0_9EUKA|mmetsp:Transcript_37326/g.84569  ORF Transcript_37326/g.84569 Transcript_37326/m.84569 type:complete len:478 (+) Transcript_37326:18-1451(+)